MSTLRMHRHFSTNLGAYRPIVVNPKAQPVRHPLGRIVRRRDGVAREEYPKWVAPAMRFPGINEIDIMKFKRETTLATTEEWFWKKHPLLTDEHKQRFDQLVKGKVDRLVMSKEFYPHFKNEEDPLWAKKLIYSWFLTRLYKNQAPINALYEDGKWVRQQLAELSQQFTKEFTRTPVAPRMLPAHVPALPSFYDKTLPYSPKYLVTQWLARQKNRVTRPMTK